MKNKPSSSEQLSQSETRLIEQLREHPEIKERFESILALANASDGPLKTADEIEELLIEEVRKLGNATMREWARKSDPRMPPCATVKKNADVVVCFWVGQRA